MLLYVTHQISEPHHHRPAGHLLTANSLSTMPPRGGLMGTRRPVSRILSWDGHYSGADFTACLDAAYPRVNRDEQPLPAYLALLRMGFTLPLAVAGSAVGSYPTISPLPVCRRTGTIGGVFSVALSVASRRPAVSRHPALWSSDFPPLRRNPERRPPGHLVPMRFKRCQRVATRPQGALPPEDISPDPSLPLPAAGSHRRIRRE